MFGLLLLASSLAAASALSARFHPLLPKNWHDVSVSNSSTTAVTSYFVTSYYPTSASCAEEPISVSALGFGACIAGYDACDKFSSAVRYTFTNKAAGVLHFDMQEFSDSACTQSTSPPKPLTLPLTCLASGAAGVQYSTAEGSGEPWMGVNKGVVSLSYDSSDCGRSPAMWSSISHNFCFPTGGTCSQPSNTQYAQYSKCSSDRATMTFFGDSACSMPNAGKSELGFTCLAGDSSSTWSSLVCNN